MTSSNREVNLKMKSVTNLVRSTQLEIPDREKREIERKGNFIIDLQCYKLFHCTVGPMGLKTSEFFSKLHSAVTEEKSKMFQ